MGLCREDQNALIEFYVCFVTTRKVYAVLYKQLKNKGNILERQGWEGPLMKSLWDFKELLDYEELWM